jgi:outer membrane protein OmpA-like peptidoglycan-associated protein
VPAGAVGQEVGPALSAEQLTRMLAPAATSARGGGQVLRALRPGGGGGGVTKVAAGTATVAAAALPPGAEGSGVVPDLRLLFPYGSAELTPATKARLDQLGRALKGPELKDYGFEIAGHTDAAGDDGYNMTLSRRRAEAVAAYLGRAHRVPKARLEAKGYGETALAEPAEPASPRNRRVEVRTLR